MITPEVTGTLDEVGLFTTIYTLSSVGKKRCNPSVNVPQIPYQYIKFIYTKVYYGGTVLNALAKSSEISILWSRFCAKSRNNDDIGMGFTRFTLMEAMLYVTHIYIYITKLRYVIFFLDYYIHTLMK